MKPIKTIKKYLLKFDKWLLAKCQKSSDKVSLFLGIGNAQYVIAYVCLISTVAIGIFRYFIKVNKGAIDILSIILLFLAGILSNWKLDRLRKQNNPTKTVHYKEPLVDEFRIIVIILTCCLSITDTIGYSYFIKTAISDQPYFFILYPLGWAERIIYSLFFYFISCTGRPAGKGKIQEKLEQLQPKPEKAEAPVKYRSAS